MQYAYHYMELSVSYDTQSKKKRKLKTSWYSFTNYCSFILFQTKLHYYLNSLFVGKILFKSYKHETRQLKWKMLSKSHSNLVSKYRHKCVFFFNFTKSFSEQLGLSIRFRTLGLTGLIPESWHFRAMAGYCRNSSGKSMHSRDLSTCSELP